MLSYVLGYTRRCNNAKESYGVLFPLWSLYTVCRIGTAVDHDMAQDKADNEGEPGRRHPPRVMAASV